MGVIHWGVMAAGRSWEVVFEEVCSVLVLCWNQSGDIWFGCFSEGFVNRGFTVIQNIGHPLSNTELFFPNLIRVFYRGKINSTEAGEHLKIEVLRI